MPRGVRGSSASKKGATNGVRGGQPPLSHPAETFREHRKFLVRSLDRNDVDMSALVELNKSLRKAKETVLRSCGELVLLDLGSGRLKLIGEELHEDVASTTRGSVGGAGASKSKPGKSNPQQQKKQRNLTAAQKEICVDFLLRMKLRRRLSNRLVRRLTRVAYAMDGKDVSPPGPPKYGDLRFQIDKKALQSKVREWKEKEDAKNRIEAAIRGMEMENKNKNKNSQVEAEEKHEKDGGDETAEKGEKEATKDLPDEAKSGKTTPKDDTAPMECSSAIQNETEPENYGEIAQHNGSNRISPNQQYYAMPELANDFKLLKEYEAAYEKMWDPSMKFFKYTIGNEEVPDPRSGNIGAISVFSNLEDLKAERKRWQTVLFRRIPQQPSAEELGLKNRVFLLEERKKRYLEEISSVDKKATEESVVKKMKLDHDQDEKSNNESSLGSKGVQQESKKMYDNDGDDDDDDDNASDKMKVDEDEKKDGENSDSEEDQEKEAERKDPIAEAITRKRFISFAPIPSFYDQDLTRIILIHKDLLNSSRVKLTKKRFKDATDEYNKGTLRRRHFTLRMFWSCFDFFGIHDRKQYDHLTLVSSYSSLACFLAYQLSTQFSEARQMIQHNLTFAIAKGRQELTKAHSDYTIAYTTAKQLWIKDKFEFDMKKSQAVLPTKWGNQPMGTRTITNYVRANYSSVHRTTVGQTLADIVDGSILVGQGKTNIQPFRDFEPPPAPGMDAKTGENMAQRQHRVEMKYRKQFSDIDTKFKDNEIERARAWRKAMKAQAENNAVCGAKGSRVTISNFHTIPVPVIRSSAQQNLKSQLVQQKAQAAKVPSSSTTATTSTTTTSTVDMSKYSAEKVKLRKAADGSVAPVTKPKKDKDGMYLRPAGRTRKGMQWDAINGVWIPQQQQQQQHS